MDLIKENLWKQTHTDRNKTNTHTHKKKTEKEKNNLTIHTETQNRELRQETKIVFQKQTDRQTGRGITGGRQTRGRKRNKQT